LVPRQEKQGRLIDYGIRTAQRRFEKYFGCTSHSFRHTRATHCFRHLGFSERFIQEYFKISPTTLVEWCERYGHVNTKDLEEKLK
jgi:integrase